MSKQRINQPFRKKYGYDHSREAELNQKPYSFETPSQFKSVQFKHTQTDICNTKFSIQSSRIADESSQISNKPIQYEQALRPKNQPFQSQTCKLLQKKDRQIYFLTVELQNYEVRFRESEQTINNQIEQVFRMKNQIQRLNSQNNQYSQNNQFLQMTLNKMGVQNSKLKQSFETLIRQKNESRLGQNKREYMSIQSNHNPHYLKREVEGLKQMVSEMEYSIRNCPSCFSLRRENQQINEAYLNLQKLYNQLNYKKIKHQKDLLQDITIKIQENQNIIRENLQLKQKRNNSSSGKMGRQKFKQSVAKRCRTLTDQF